MTSRNRFTMADLDTPKLRPGLRATTGREPNTVVMEDQFRLGGPLMLSRAAFDLIRLFDGREDARRPPGRGRPSSSAARRSPST